MMDRTHGWPGSGPTAFRGDVNLDDGDLTLDDGGTYVTTVQCITPTADRVVSFPDATGTVGLVAGSSGQLISNQSGAYAGVASSSVDGSGNITIGTRFISSLNGAASAPPVTLAGTWFTGGTATTTKPALLIEPTGTTSTAWSTSGTGLGVNAPSGFSGRILDLQVNGATQFGVTSAGTIIFGGGGTIAGSTSGTRITLTSANGPITYTSSGTASGHDFNGTVRASSIVSSSITGTNGGGAGGGTSGQPLTLGGGNAFNGTVSHTGVSLNLVGGNAGGPGDLNGGNVNIDGGTPKNNGLAGNVVIGGTRGNLQITDARDVILGTTTGTKIGTATSQKLAFYNKTPIVQPTTGVAEAAFVENSGGTAVNVDSTFGGYTIQQVVQALQNLGFLA